MMSKASFFRRIEQGLLAPVLAVCLFATQQHTSAAATTAGDRMFPILTYHHLEVVNDTSDKLRVSLAIRPDVLERQLLALRSRKYVTVFVRDIPHMLHGDIPTPMRHVALTFDDGYEDFYTNAFPLLEKYKAKATLFIINDLIGKPDYLTWPQVQEILQSGLVEIGAHTLDPPDLTKLSLDQARSQIQGSKSGLELNLGVDIETFAYPYGKYSRQVEMLVQQAGFSAAVTTDRGFRQSSRDYFTFERIPAGAFEGQKKWRSLGEAL